MNSTAQELEELGYSPKLLNLIIGRTSITNDCWIWTGTMGGPGKRQPNVRDYLSKVYNPRRIFFEIQNGKVPRYKHVINKCGNYRCVFPGHAECNNLGPEATRPIIENANRFLKSKHLVHSQGNLAKVIKSHIVEAEKDLKKEKEFLRRRKIAEQYGKNIQK